MGATAEKPTTYVAEFERAYQDADASVRRAAIRVIGQHKELAEMSIATLAVGLTDSDQRIRADAAVALALAGGVAKQAGSVVDRLSSRS